MQNRRNYYRILYVQPDASTEVIKDSYRTLMQKLRMHPDLGGEDWNASVVNQAYATLRDPTKRKEYDKALLSEHDITTLSQGHLKIPPSNNDTTGISSSSYDNNQRNYYRILHVQPDAKAVVINASYQVLKNQKNAPAVLLDEAWMVLSDKKKRAHYDKSLQQGSDDPQEQPPLSDTQTLVEKSRLANQKNKAHFYKQNQSGNYEAIITSYCLFCKTPYARSQHIEDSQGCSICDSPLFSPPQSLVDQPRRWLTRMQQNTTIVFYEYWPGQQYNGNLLDLSPTGLRFSSQHNMELGQVIKIDGNGFAAVAEVTYCQQTPSITNTGVRFTAVSFDRQSGSFFSTSV